MANVATWLVATHFRPALLEACLATLNACHWPDGWAAETVVSCHMADKDAPVIAKRYGAALVASTKENGAAKRNVGLRHATGKLILVADDDDMQSDLRVLRAVAAFEDGHRVTAIKEFRYMHLATGQVARWCGRGDVGKLAMQSFGLLDRRRRPGFRPRVPVGTARNYNAGILKLVDGWSDLPRLIEKDIQGRIHHRMGILEHDLGPEMAQSTICVQHDDNVWDDRPFPENGFAVERGGFIIVGEGHFSEAPNFPMAVADRLGLL